MNYDDIFKAYYTQYRAEADVPASDDDEYILAMPLANEAINRWANYDNTMWQELYTTVVGDGGGDTELIVNQTEYSAPSNMKIPGGGIRVTDLNGNFMRNIPVIPAEEVQFMGDMVSYAYFTGNQTGGFTLTINPAPQQREDGFGINYVYYKKPTLITKGTTKVEMADPYFIVHRMLANRFRSSRNPYYTSAKGDAEDALRTMQLANNSGNWAAPWSVPDRSGTTFGG